MCVFKECVYTLAHMLCRSEMHSPQVSLRFGLLLEAYLRGSPNHMTEFTKQVKRFQVTVDNLLEITRLLRRILIDYWKLLACVCTFSLTL